jgi:hypothetical protein
VDGEALSIVCAKYYCPPHYCLPINTWLAHVTCMACIGAAQVSHGNSNDGAMSLLCGNGTHGEVELDGNFPSSVVHCD